MNACVVPAKYLPSIVTENLQFVVVVNDNYKFKVLETNNFETVLTIAGPCYDSPISKLNFIQNLNTNNLKYFVFQTDHSIGIQNFPLDGNPLRRVGVYASANKIIQMCVSHDLAYVFIVANNEKSISMWKINIKAVDAITVQEMTELEVFCTQLPGGKTGWLLREILDMFYYIQIIGKGLESHEKRDIGDMIKVSDVPDFMRGLGFFPSDYEVRIYNAL